MDVLEADDQRFARGHGFEEAADRPEALVAPACDWRRTDRALNELHDDICVFAVLHRLGDRRDPAGFAHDLSQRPEGDSIAIWEAPSGQPCGAIAERGAEFSRQTGLSDPRRPDDSQQPTGVRAHRLVEALSKPAELGTATDERRVEPAREAGREDVD